MLRNKWTISRKANDTPDAPRTEILAQVSIDNEDGTFGALVATVAPHGTADIDNKYAAQIAAAPDLLEALELLSAFFIGAYENDERPDNTITKERLEAERLGRLAIAKAKAKGE